MERTARIQRRTKETDIDISLELDGVGQADIDTGIPFLDHMLDHLATHGLFDLSLRARGDLEVDPHHTVEDVGICLGQAFRQSVGDKRGIMRFGSSLVPMDDALALVSLDVSGRPHLVYEVGLEAETIGNYDTSLTQEFLQALANHFAITLHVQKLAGSNAHHVVEAVFKGLARALEMALKVDSRRREQTPSTKGEL